MTTQQRSLRLCFHALPQVCTPRLVRGFATAGVLIETFEPGESVARYMKTPGPMNTQIVALGVDTYLKVRSHCSSDPVGVFLGYPGTGAALHDMYSRVGFRCSPDPACAGLFQAQTGHWVWTPTRRWGSRSPYGFVPTGASRHGSWHWVWTPTW